MVAAEASDERRGLPRAPQLPDRIALVLRDRILAGDLPPGTFLRLDQIADELGVSPTPVREALQTLRADDLVRALPRRGFVVAPLRRGDLLDLFEVEARITGELAARAARRVDDDGVAHLRELSRGVDERIAELDADPAPERGTSPGRLPRDDGDPMVDAEHRLHVAVNRTAGSRKLAWLVGRALIYVPRTFYTRSHAWRAAAKSSHRELVDAVAARDDEAARAAMSAHVHDGRDLLLAHLDTVGLWSPTETRSEPDPT